MTVVHGVDGKLETQELVSGHRAGWYLNWDGKPAPDSQPASSCSLSLGPTLAENTGAEAFTTNAGPESMINKGPGRAEGVGRLHRAHQGQCCRSDCVASPCTPGVPVHLQGEGTPRGNVLILQLMRAGGLVPTNGQLWGQHLGNSHKGECRDPTTGTCAFLQECAYAFIRKTSTSHLGSESAGIPATLSRAFSEGC